MSELLRKLKDFFETDAGEYNITIRDTDYRDWDRYQRDLNAWRAAKGDNAERPDYSDYEYETPVVKEHKYGTEEYESPYEALGFSEVYEYLEGQGKALIIEGIGTLEKIESYGGEGQGDQYWYILKVTPGGSSPQEQQYEERFFKVDGYYQSYDGGYYDEVYEVFPKKVVKTEWEQS